jgi:hypothetical protein
VADAVGTFFIVLGCCCAHDVSFLVVTLIERLFAERADGDH